MFSTLLGSLSISSAFLSASPLSVKILNLSSVVLSYYLHSRYKGVFPLSSGIVYGFISAMKLYCLYHVVGSLSSGDCLLWGLAK